MAIKVIRQMKEGGNALVLRCDHSKLLPVFHRLELAVQQKATYIVNMGGGGSSKSYSTAQHLVKKCLKKRCKILVVRKTAVSIADSVFEEFKENALPFWGLTEGRDYRLKTSPHQITFPLTRSKIIFKGMDNPEKVKSISGITDVWYEEITELDENEFNVSNDRIRGNPTIYMSFNPISEQHWLKKRFIDRCGLVMDQSGECPGLYRFFPDHHTAILFSTYRENPYIGSKYVRDMRSYKRYNPDHYRVYGLGLWGIIRPDNPFFVWRGRSFHQREGLKFDPYMTTLYMSWDFNINNTVLISQRVPGEWVKYLALWHGGGDLKEMCQRIVNTFGRQNLFYFTGDGSGNNGSAVSEGNLAAWQLIEKYFREFNIPSAWLNFGAVPKANSSTAVSRTVANMMIAYYSDRMEFDKTECAILLDDIDRMMALPNGSLDKQDCKKHNYGHAGDTFRYDLQNFDGVIIKQKLGEEFLKSLSSGNQHNKEAA